MIADLLTRQRLDSYLSKSDGDVDAAVMLYDWNIEASGAVLSLVSTVEVVVRNALDAQLSAWSQGTRGDVGVVRSRVSGSVGSARGHRSSRAGGSSAAERGAWEGGRRVVVGVLAVPRGVAVFDVVVGAGAPRCVSVRRLGCAAAS